MLCCRADGQLEGGSDGSVRASDNSLLLLGSSSVVMVKVLTWSDRVEALISNRQWVDALALALDFYDGQAKAAIGLPRDPATLKLRLRDQLVDYITQYVTAELAESAASDRVQLRLIGGCAMEYCACIERMDLVFSSIYEQFLRLAATDVLVELLEPFILNDRMEALEPLLMTRFLNYYLADSSRLPQLEQCLLHLNAMKLELNVVLPTVRRVRLFTALIHIYNAALNDFATPIADIITAIVLGLGFHAESEEKAEAAAAQSHSFSHGGDSEADGGGDEPERVVIGARLPALTAADKTDYAFAVFLYIDYAFTGRAFPKVSTAPALRQQRSARERQRLTCCLCLSASVSACCVAGL